MPAIESLPKLSAGFPLTRRRFLQGGLIGAAALVLYSGEVERHWVEERFIEIHLNNLPSALDGLRIVQLSDIHLDSYTEAFFLRSVVGKINALNPDVVLLTGDFVSAGPRSRKAGIRAAWECGEILSELHCAERYGILGNHDAEVGSREVIAAMAARGIPILRNGYLPIDRQGGRLWLAGLDDALYGHPNPEMAIPQSIRNRPNEPVILMAHEPDYVDVLLKRPVGRAVELVLSGHTHGGQIRLPFLGPIVLPDMGRKYLEGLFRLGEAQLYVSRGIGAVGVPFRFNCPPELTQITLRREQK